MKKWNLIIDVAECTNCNLCTLASMDEYVDNDFPGYSAPMPKHGHRWIDILQKERGQIPTIDIAYVPTLCNHCDNAPCVAKGGGAVSKRADGIVLIDPVKAKGRKDLVEFMPLRPHLVERGAQVAAGLDLRCSFDRSGLEADARPAVLPDRRHARGLLEDAEMTQLALEQNLEVIKPELGTRPRVYYKNLWRYTSCFIAGSVSAKAKGAVDCVEGASVRLLKSGAVVAQAKTDNYGDFKFDRLDENSGDYVVEISAGKAKKSVPARLGASISLGEIRL